MIQLHYDTPVTALRVLAEMPGLVRELAARTGIPVPRIAECVWWLEAEGLARCDLSSMVWSAEEETR